MNSLRFGLGFFLVLSAVGRSSGASFSPANLANEIDGLFGSSNPDLKALAPVLASLKGVDLGDLKQCEALAPVFTAVQTQVQALQAIPAPAPRAAANPVLTAKYLAADVLGDFQRPETRADVESRARAYEAALPVDVKEQIRADLLALHREDIVKGLGPLTSAAPAKGPGTGRPPASPKISFNGRSFPADVSPEESGSVLERLVAAAKVSVDLPEGGAVGPDLQKALDAAVDRGVAVRVDPKNVRAPGSTVVLFDDTLALTGSSLTLDPEKIRAYRAFLEKAQLVPAVEKIRGGPFRAPTAKEARRLAAIAMIEARRAQSAQDRIVVRGGVLDGGRSGSDAVSNYEIQCRSRREGESRVAFGSHYEGRNGAVSAFEEATAAMNERLRQMRASDNLIVEAKVVNESVRGGAALFSYRIEFRPK